MILGFKLYFPWREPNFFWQKIMASIPVPLDNPQSSPGNMFSSYQPKLHTIREGQRWKAGDVLHMATGVRSKNYHQFNKDIEELSKCRAVQRFDLTYRNRNCVALYIDKQLKYCKNGDHVFEIEPCWMDWFARNDGFKDAEQFFRWFTASVRNGQIIHWTDLKY